MTKHSPVSAVAVLTFFCAGFPAIAATPSASSTPITFALGYGNVDTGAQATAVRITSDGGYVIAGYNSFDLSQSSYIVKTDVNGNPQWQTEISEASTPVNLNWIQQTSDSGYILCGYLGAADNQTFFAAKLTSSGSITWQNTYGPGPSDLGAIVQTSAGNYVAVGVYMGTAWLLELDPNGNLLAQYTYYNANIASASSIVATSDGGFVIAVGVGLMKVDSNFNPVWTESGYAASSVQPTSDGGFVVAGTTRQTQYCPFGFEACYFTEITRTDEKGVPAWSRLFGNSFVMNPTAVQTADGGYVLNINGYSETPTAILKLDSHGISLGQSSFNGVGTFIQPTSDGGIILVGTSFLLPDEGSQFLALKLGADLTIPACSPLIAQKSFLVLDKVVLPQSINVAAIPGTFSAATASTTATAVTTAATNLCQVTTN